MRYLVLLLCLIFVLPALADEVTDATVSCDALRIPRDHPAFDPLKDRGLFAECVSGQRVRQAESAAIAKIPTLDAEAAQKQAAQLRSQQQSQIDAIRSQFGLPKQ